MALPHEPSGADDREFIRLVLAYVNLRHHLYRVSIIPLLMLPQFLLLLWSHLSTLIHPYLESFDGIVLVSGLVKSVKTAGLWQGSALEALAVAGEGLGCIWVAVAPVP